MMREKIFAVLKLCSAILLLPLVIGITASFWQSFKQLDGSVVSAFGWGVVAYLLLHIVLYQPAKVFDTGQKMAEKAMGFFAPLFKAAGLCVPIFTILSFILYLLSTRIWPQVKDYFSVFVFLASFTLTMHVVFTANALKGKSAGWLKENYFFALFFIYIINMLIIAAAFNVLSGDFSFIDFINSAWIKAYAIYTASFRQLFEVEGRRPV